METKNIIQQGTVAKYAIQIDREGFSEATDDFAVRLSWGMRGRSMTISKEQMQPVKDGRWLFTFDTTGMIGRITAATMLQVPDTDMAGGSMQEVDRQVIALVTESPCPRYMTCPRCDTPEHGITFERILEPGMAEKYRYLCDAKGRRLLTADNEYILVLAEQRNNDITI